MVYRNGWDRLKKNITVCIGQVNSLWHEFGQSRGQINSDYRLALDSLTGTLRNVQVSTIGTMVLKCSWVYNFTLRWAGGKI